MESQQGPSCLVQKVFSLYIDSTMHPLNSCGVGGSIVTTWQPASDSTHAAHEV